MCCMLKKECAASRRVREKMRWNSVACRCYFFFQQTCDSRRPRTHLVSVMVLSAFWASVYKLFSLSAAWTCNHDWLSHVSWQRDGDGAGSLVVASVWRAASRHQERKSPKAVLNCDVSIASLWPLLVGRYAAEATHVTPSDSNDDSNDDRAII